MKDLAELHVQRRDLACIVGIAGEVDLSNAQELLASIERAVPRDTAMLIVDLSRTRYLDSAGVRILFTLAGRLRSRRQALRIVAPPDALVRPVLQLMDVASVAPLSPDVEEALASPDV